MVFSGTFKQVQHPSAAFGANLVGAMLGGFAEYLSMATGRRSLLVLVVAAYLVSLLASRALADKANVTELRRQAA